MSLSAFNCNISLVIQEPCQGAALQLDVAQVAVRDIVCMHFLKTRACARSPLSVGGDGRADRPGHSVKYGLYGLIDLDTNKVIHIQLV